MTAYLKSWLYGPSESTAAPSISPVATSSSRKAEVVTDVNADVDTEPEVSLTIEAPDAESSINVGDTNGEPADDDDDADSDATETDIPPAFPALNSAQRMASSSMPTTLPSRTSATLNMATATKSKNSLSPLPRVLTDAQRMPPPPVPALRVPGVPPSRLSASVRTSNASSSLMPPPSSSSSSGATLGVPPTTSKPFAKNSRDKVALAPGFGPLDWAALKASGTDLRGVESLTRVTPSMLKEHRGRNGDDTWTAINGKVYNITAYLPFHPGGEKELMRVAGRDGTKLFGLTHAWVNAEFMLDSCLVGFLVSESYGS